MTDDDIRAEIAEIAEALGPDWRFEPHECASNRDRGWLIRSDMLQLYLLQGWRFSERGRLEIKVWPINLDQTVTDHHLARPFITVARSRTPRAIAKDITRRFLGQAEEFTARVLNLHAADQRRADAVQELTNQLIQIWGPAAFQTVDRTKTVRVIGPYGPVDIYDDGDGIKAHFDLRLNADDALTLAADLATLSNNVDGLHACA